LKALLTWIDYGVLEEVEGREGMFRVLEVAKERKRGGGGGGGGEGEERTRQGKLYSFFALSCIIPYTVWIIFLAVAAHVQAQESNLPPAISMQQQQQAEQMRVYWKVSKNTISLPSSLTHIYFS
jgi:anaphase-promoting complex subunit 2